MCADFGHQVYPIVFDLKDPGRPRALGSSKGYFTTGGIRLDTQMAKPYFTDCDEIL